MYHGVNDFQTLNKFHGLHICVSRAEVMYIKYVRLLSAHDS